MGGLGILAKHRKKQHLLILLDSLRTIKTLVRIQRNGLLVLWVKRKFNLNQFQLVILNSVSQVAILRRFFLILILLQQRTDVRLKEMLEVSRSNLRYRLDIV